MSPGTNPTVPTPDAPAPGVPAPDAPAPDAPAPDAPAPVLLDPWAARSCPVKTQNTYDPRITGRFAAPPPDEGLRELFAGTEEWLAEVSDQLATVAGAVDLRTAGTAAPSLRSLQAMGDGAAVVIGGQLPDDPDGHRRGWVDVLVRGADAAPGVPGYHPVQVKNHKVREGRSPRVEAQGMQVSPLESPAWADSYPVVGGFRTGRRERDVIQLAHLWRMLQACGHAAAGPPLAAVIGNDQPAGLTWVPLAEPRFRTFSRRSSEGWRLRSGLERYDHEHQFRVAVAERARRLTEPGVTAMVSPIRVSECDRCQWWEHCRPQLDAEDLSLRIAKAPLDVREISVLRSLGVATTTALADTDLEQLLPHYLPEVAHRAHAERRLRLTRRRAQMIGAGVTLERLEPGPVPVASAELEIDFDIETSAEDRVYLWGFLVNDTVARTSEFHSFVAWEDLDHDAEIALAEQALGWLRTLLDGPRSVLVYHYSDYETVRIGQLAHRADGPGSALRWARDETAEAFVDLFATVRDALFGVDGLGLKVVATEGAGFQWRDDDPGGLNSQAWFADAVHGDSPETRELARTRVLEYNEDDVRATAALRDWLRSLT